MNKSTKQLNQAEACANARLTEYPEQGWIYILEHEGTHFKIGRTAHFDKRIKQLKIQLPFPVTIAYAFASGDCVGAEATLHRLFAEKRLNGEWFRLDTEDFAVIAEMYNYAGFYELKDGTIKRDPFYEETCAEFARWQRLDAERWKEDDFLDLACGVEEINEAIRDLQEQWAEQAMTALYEQELLRQQEEYQRQLEEEYLGGPEAIFE